MLKMIEHALRAALHGHHLLTGEVTVTPAVPEIDIKTGWRPKRVFVHFDDGGSQVCGSNHDSFDIKITQHGFVIQCHIHSNSRIIEWIAIG